jgi:hypothetical protein
VSKALSMSKNTAAVDILLLKLGVMWSASHIHCSVVLWRARKPNWPAFNRHLSSMCFWTIFRMTILASVVLLITHMHGPSRKHCFQQYLLFTCVSVAVGTCCLETAVIYLLTSRSLHNNGSTRYNIGYKLYVHLDKYKIAIKCMIFCG